GVAADMDIVMDVAHRHNLYVIEDAAQGIDSYYKQKPLGSIGHLGAFSFHETKNIISGEGGLLTINDSKFKDRSEIIWEKGTNRSAFFKGEVDKYGWVDTGSSFLPSDIIAAFLYAQLENLEKIQTKRKVLWHSYFNGLQYPQDSGKISLPSLPEYATNNAHMFYVVTESATQRDGLISYLKEKGVHAVFHYLSLHKSTFYESLYGKAEPLVNADRYSENLIRLPLFYELETAQVEYIVDCISQFYKK